MKTRILLLLLSFSALVSSAQVGPVRGKQIESATGQDQVWMSGSDLKGAFRVSPFPKWADTTTHIATKTNVLAVDNKLIANGTFSAGTMTLTRKDGTTLGISMDGYWIPLSQKAAANGVASLGTDGKVPASQLPAQNVSDVFVVSSRSAMLALAATQGDIAVRTDSSITYVLQQGPPTEGGNWILLPTGASITSVNGQAGPAVTLNTDNISEGAVNKYYLDSRARAAFTGVGAISVNNTNGQISLAASGVTAGTWNNVTVNAQGIVTGASNIAYLQAADLAAYETKTNLLTSGASQVHWNNLTNVPANISLSIERQERTGSTSTTLTLNYTPKFPAALQVYLNGVMLHAADYSISGTTLTFGIPLLNSDYIAVVYAR